MDLNKKIKGIAKWIRETKKTSIFIIVSTILFVVFSIILPIYGYISGYSSGNLLSDIRSIATDISKRTEEIDNTTKETNKTVSTTLKIMEGLIETDCCKLEELWEIIGNAVIEDKYFILDKGEIKGTIRLRKSLYNLLILEIEFIPISDENMDTIFSLKDRDKNELVLTISDGDKSINLSYREKGEMVYSNEKDIISSIEKGKKIKLRIVTGLKSESISASAIFSYVPSNKPSGTVTDDIDIEVPYDFKKGDFSLHIGLRGSRASEENIKLDIVSCSIWEQPKTKIDWNQD